MRAGGLRYRLEVLRPTITVSEFGEEQTTWEVCRTVRAERVKLNGGRSLEVGETFPDYTAEFNVRYAHPVEENWRVRQLGGDLFTVSNVVPNLERGFKTLQCERVNE